MTDATLLAASTDSPAAAETPAEGAATEVAAAEANTEQAQAETPAAEGETPETPAEGDAEKDTPEGAPEEYADFVVPEGVALDAEVTSEFRTVAKELNLPQAQAQRVVDMGVQLAQRWSDAQAAQVQEIQSGWRREAEADAEIGGEALPQNLAIAKKALDAYASDGLRTLLEDTRLGDHPEVIRFFAKVGKTLSEDGIVTPSGTAPAAPKSLAERIFKTP